MKNTTDRSSRATIAADRAAAAALRAAHLALRLVRVLTSLASASARTSALTAATTAHLAATTASALAKTAASRPKVANARSVLARALRRRAAPLFRALPRLPKVSREPTAKDPNEQAPREYLGDQHSFQKKQWYLHYLYHRNRCHLSSGARRDWSRMFDRCC